MVKKLFTIVVACSIIIIGITQKDLLLPLVEKGGITSIVVSILLVFICVFLPVIPFPVVASLIAAVFGVLYGILISIIGAMLGTITMFILIRYGFRESAQNKLKKYPKAKEYEAFFERNSFIAILLSRLIPIIPSPVVNIVCGLSKVNFLIFVTASTLGKLPNIIILSVAGANLSNNKWMSIAIYGTYFLVILIINTIIVYRRMSKSEMEPKIEM